MKRIVYNAKTGKTTEENFVAQAPDLNQMKKSLTEMLSQKTTGWIFNRYTDIKQRSDISDKVFYENYLENHIQDQAVREKLRIELINSGKSIMVNNSTIQKELERILSLFPVPQTTTQAEFSKAIEQLIKVITRAIFVQACKDIHREFLQKINNANSINELPDLSTIKYPEMPKL